MFNLALFFKFLALQKMVAPITIDGNNLEMSKKVLYVDDDVAILDLIKLLLEQAGYTAVTARNTHGRP